jgi:GNAT superfamily N-acetyltransferase
VRVIRLRSLTEADLPFGIHLTTQAGWNQTAADWRRACELQPDGCFLAELDGAAVGTLATCVFGSVAWIALVLVDAAVRGRGVGTALMRHALAYLERQGVRSVRLDATPLGQPVYEKLDFIAQFALARYEGIMPGGTNTAGVERGTPDHWEDVLRLDRAVTATDRRKLLTRLFTETPDALAVCRRGTAVHGFVTSRPGANAIQVGPCLATTREAGEALLAHTRWTYAGQRVYIDVPVENRPAVQAVADMGFTVQRPLLRMCRGEPVQEHVEELWASAGPEKG